MLRIRISNVEIEFWKKKGFFKEAGRQIFNEAMNAAGEYVGNAIQEMLVVKKEAEHPRILPSLEHMKIVSNERKLAE